MRACRGVTLIEILVVTGILAFIMGVLLAAVNVGNRTMTISQAQVTATQEARRGLTEMSREIIQAPVAQITDESETDSWPPDDEAGWTGIRFRYPEGVDENGAVDAWSSYITYSFDEVESQLVRTDEDGGTRVLANGVESIAFRDGSDTTDDVMLIEMTTQRTATTDHVMEQPLAVRIRVRNE